MECSDVLPLVLLCSCLLNIAHDTRTSWYRHTISWPNAAYILWYRHASYHICHFVVVYIATIRKPMPHENYGDPKVWIESCTPSSSSWQWREHRETLGRIRSKNLNNNHCRQPITSPFLSHVRQWFPRCNVVSKHVFFACTQSNDDFAFVSSLMSRPDYKVRQLSNVSY